MSASETQFKMSADFSHTTLAVDMSDEVDKTGFDYVRTQAVLLASQAWQTLPKSGLESPTIGPASREEPETYSLPSKPKRESKRVSKLNLGSVTPPNEVDLEYEFCRKKVLAELDKISLREAEEQKIRRMRAWVEHDKRAAAFVAEKSAVGQAEELVRRHEMHKRREKLLQEMMDDLSQMRAQRATEEQIRLNEKVQQIEQANKEKLKKQREKYDAIHQCQVEFGNTFKTIFEELKKNSTGSFKTHLDAMKNANEKLVSLTAKPNIDNISDLDVEEAQKLLKEAQEILNKIKEDLARQEEESLKKLKEEEELKKKQSEPPTTTDSSEVRKSGLELILAPYYKYEQNLVKVEASLREFTTNETFKKMKVDCQTAINVPINAISGLSGPHLIDKLNKLTAFLSKKPVIINDKKLSAANHPQALLFSFNFLALKIVKQGEQLVSTNLDAAFPLAAVVVALCTDIPDLRPLLMAQFHRTCPYLIPYYWDREPNQTDQEYDKKLGFLYVNGEKEDVDKFLKRQSGVVALYSAIIVTPHKMSNQGKPHPLPLAEAWRWLSAFVYLEPRANISATFLLQMLDITGNLMLRTYGLQFRKMLHSIVVTYLPLVEKVTPPGRGGPVTRLRLFLEDVVSGNSIPPPKGLLPPNFW